MTDLFLDPKVLDYPHDRYELILYTLRWARQLKARGSATPMAELIEQALKDIVENKITKEEIMANKLVSEEPAADAAAPAEGVIAPLDLSIDDEGEDGKKAKAKKKKKKE